MKKESELSKKMEKLNKFLDVMKKDGKTHINLKEFNTLIKLCN